MIKKGIKDSFWSVLDTVLYIGIYLAALPILIHHLGKESFGLWLFLNALMAVLQMIHMNTGVSATRNVSYYAATSDKKGIANTINSVFAINVVAGVIIILISIIAALVEQSTGFFHIREHQHINYINCFLLTGFVSASRGFYPTLQGIFRAYSRFRMAAILNIISRCSVVIANVCLVVNGYGVEYMLWANLLVTVLFLVLQQIFIRRLLPFYRFSVSLSGLTDKGTLSYSFWPWVQSLFVILAFQTDRLWVAAFSGLSEVSSYGLVSTLFNYIHMIFLALVAWVLPAFSQAAAKNASSEELYRKATSLLFIIGVPSLLLFYFLSPVLVRMWLGGNVYGDAVRYIKAYTIFQLIFLFTILPFYYLNAIGKGSLAARCTIGYCLFSYLCMLTALLLFKDPLYMIYAMAASLCMSMPVLNTIVNKSLSGSLKLTLSLKEILAVYTAIIFLITPYTILRALASVFIIILLGYNYFSPIFAKVAGRQLRRKN